MPLWESHGVDREQGGFFETLMFDPNNGGYEALGEIRRGRVVARQIYAFDAGHRLGWQGRQPNAVEHGCNFLYSRLLHDSGIFRTSMAVGGESTAIGRTSMAGGESTAVGRKSAVGSDPVAAFSLYEHAFYLFALARAKASMGGAFPIEATALTCLRELRARFGKPNGGFDESSPPTMPLKSNPHMHMLEAALAWIGVSGGPTQAAWVVLAREIVTLCLTHFIDPATGALREYFDDRWRPMPDASGRIVEPGHQFEWGWLLFGWGSLGHCSVQEKRNCHAAARTLIELGERHGVDPARGVAFNELWDDLTPKDRAAKIWPQTERVKAWCSMLQHAESFADAQHASERLGRATQGLSRYLATEPRGLWHEALSHDDFFSIGACKASSFYHIVCAIETLEHTLNDLAGRPADSQARAADARGRAAD